MKGGQEKEGPRKTQEPRDNQVYPRNHRPDSRNTVSSQRVLEVSAGAGKPAPPFLSIIARLEYMSKIKKLNPAVVVVFIVSMTLFVRNWFDWLALISVLVSSAAIVLSLTGGEKGAS